MVPFTVNVKPAPPVDPEVGDIDVIVGTVLSTLNGCEASDVPPPGVGFDTVTGMVPAVARSVLGTVAVKTVGLV